MKSLSLTTYADVDRAAAALLQRLRFFGGPALAAPAGSNTPAEQQCGA